MVVTEGMRICLVVKSVFGGCNEDEEKYMEVGSEKMRKLFDE